MEIKLKRMPFSIDLAKKITEGKIKGAKIITKNGIDARILAFDLKGDYPIAVAITLEDDTESVCAMTEKGCFYNIPSLNDLCLLVPTSYKDYSNFEPQKWQPCLVRDYFNKWVIRVATGEHTESNKPYFFGSLPDYNTKERYDCFLPISKTTIKLLGTTKSYAELMEE